MLEDTEGSANWIEIFENQDFTHSISFRDTFNTLYVGVDSGATAPGIYKLEKRQGQWRVVKGPIALEGSSVFDMETGAESGTIYVATELGLFAIDRSDSVKTLKTFPAS